MDDSGVELRRNQKVGELEFLKGLPAGAYEVDGQGDYLYCNEEAAKILGFDSSEELLGKNIYDLYFDREYRHRILDRMRKAGGRLESYIHWKRKNGSEVVVNDYAEFVYDDKGNEAGVRGIFVEATYEQLFDDLNAGIYRIGPDRKTVLLVNRAVARIFGFRSPEEMEGIDISKLYLRYEDYKRFVKELEEKEKVENRSLEMKRNDGEVITISVSCRLLKDEGGKIIGREGTFTDVTEQEKYRGLLEQPLGIYEAQLKDKKPIIVYCNETFAQMFGYTSKDEVIGMCIHELYANKGDIPIFEERVREADRKNEPVIDHLLRVERRKGEQGEEKKEKFWIKIFCYPIENEEGEIIGRKGNIEDVSDKLELERILKTRREIQRFIHGFIAPMMSIHSTSQVVAKEVERSVGIRYGADDMDRLRKKKRNILALLEEIKSVSESLIKKMDEAITLCKSEVFLNEKDIQELVRIKDELGKEIEDVVRRIIEVRKLHKDAREGLTRFHSFVRTERNIKDSRRISDQIRSCFIDLDELDSTYILYLTQSILNKSKIAYHEVEGLRQLMMRTGEEEEDQLFEFQSTNIVDMIEEIIDMYRIDASLKGISIHSPQGKITDIDISRNHVERLISYVIQNAVKYSFKREGYIHVDLSEQVDFIQIDVEDYGVGILPEEIESGKIFEYGYRGEFSRDRNRTGSGIGLSESKRIAEAHNGVIRVKSIPLANAGDNINHNTPHKTTVSIIFPKKQSRRGD
ncbi:MAG: PAS domain-containing protein [Theionarchaea archaeon]|nr:PAS domain-containing protein [Theionarchaea archaeon]